MKNNFTHSEIFSTRKVPSITTIMVCFYIFLVIERPWESVRYLEGIPVERTYAIIMIGVALLHQKFKIVKSPTNKWVYGLLALHFILAPFAFKAEYALDQSVEYAKMVVLYLLMLSVADDEKSLKVLVRAYILSMMFYMLHSLWEYQNGRHVWRMGISRLIGVDVTYGDPNAFGASVVLSLSFVYALLRTEVTSLMRKVYYGYFGLAVVCIILTGSRSAFVALIVLLLFWGVMRKGNQKIPILFVALLAIGTIWISMPEEKRERIRTLWDSEAGPKNAHDSAGGRIVGLKVSWEMFKREPFTGVGAGGKNFIGYRMANGIDKEGHESPTQAHVLYGEVLAEFGVFGVIFFAGLVLSIWRCSLRVRRAQETEFSQAGFIYHLSGAIIASLFLLLLLGLGGHNFYRPLWPWLAAWSGSLYMAFYKAAPRQRTFLQ